jgi:hypothetical protein
MTVGIPFLLGTVLIINEIIKQLRTIAKSFTSSRPQTTKLLMITSVVIGFSASGWAQNIDAGKTAYLSSCAACHGEDAKGNGVLTPVLKIPPADLTTLARRNDGVFPIAAINEIIDGRTLIAAHGTREMPIWGFDVMVRNRIAEIIDYLNRIQRK